MERESVFKAKVERRRRLFRANEGLAKYAMNLRLGSSPTRLIQKISPRKR